MSSTPVVATGSETVTFPMLPTPLVTRDNVVGPLGSDFSDKTRAILVCGAAGSGKTTILAQFVQANASRCVSYFIGNEIWSSTTGYYLWDVCNQMRSMLGQKTLSSSASVARLTQEFPRLVSEIHRFAGKSEQPLFFVIDGLNRAHRSGTGDSILRFLPRLRKNVYLLGSATSKESVDAPEVDFKVYDLPPLSSADTAVLLQDLGLTASQVQQIRKASDGLPAYVAEVREQILQGASVNDLLSNLPAAISGLYESDWEKWVNGEDLSLSLAVLAFSSEAMDVTEWASVCRKDPPQIAEWARSFPFLSLTADTQAVAFRSNTWRRFAMNKLGMYQAGAESLLIEYYERDPYTRRSQEILPILLQKTHKPERLKKLINNDYLLRTLDSKRDLALLHSSLLAAGDAALETGDLPALLRYACESGVVGTATDRVPGAYGEVAALVAMEDWGDAEDIANTALLPEDRLQALSIIARGMRKAGLSVAQEIEDSIDQLAELVSTTLPWKMVIGLAIQMFDVRPQTAVGLLERCAGAGEGRVLDHALAALSLTSNRTDSSEELQTRIQDEALRDFVRAQSPALAVMRPEEAIAQAAAVTDTSARLFVLRDWCNSNKNNPKAHTVISTALTWITEATSYTPSLRLLRQLAEPLRAAPYEIAGTLLIKLLSLKESLPEHPAEERIRLELLIAELESQTNHTAALDRLLNAYVSLDGISDLDIRTFGLARVLLSLREIDPEDRHNFREDILASLHTNLDALLKDSASHYDVTRRLIRSATSLDFDLGLEIAGKLNTETRRDEAHAEAIEVFCGAPKAMFDLQRALQAAERITDQHRVRGPAIVQIASELARLERIPKPGDADILRAAILALPDPYDRAFAHAWTAKWISSTDPQRVLTEINLAEEAAKKIDEPWKSVDTRYGIVRIIASVDRPRARRILQDLGRGFPSTWEADPVFGPLYVNTVALAVMSTLGLAEKDQEVERTFAPLLAVVHAMPSLSFQGKLLAGLAVRLYLADKHQLAEELAKKVLDLLEQVEDPHARNELFVVAAPALYEYDPAQFKSMLGGFDKETRVYAVQSAFSFVLTKNPPDVPIKHDQLRVDIEYRAAGKAGELIGLFEVDGYIADGIRDLVNAIFAEPWQCPLSARQLKDLANQLEEITKSRLPDPNNIQHRGYEILARAQIERLRYAAAQQKPKVPPWIQLSKEIETIPNVADRALVYAMVAEDIFRQWPDEAHRMLEIAEKLIPQIPNQLDRVQRMLSIGDAHSQGNDANSARFFLQKAFEDLRSLAQTSSTSKLADQILESAHSLSPQFGASLTPLIDDKLRRYSLEEKSKAISVHKQPANVGWVGEQRTNPDTLRSAARELRRSLASGRAGAQAEFLLLRWLRTSMLGSFEDVYEVAAWVGENVRAGNRTRQVHSEVFSALMENVRFAKAFAGVIVDRARSDREDPNPANIPERMQLFRAGSRDVAMLNVASWIGEHAEEYLIISDPFFSISDLDILRAVPHGIEVRILTAWKAQKGLSGKKDERVPHNDLPKLYETAWKQTSDIDPPSTMVTVLCSKSYKSPLHDRYILTRSGGLRLGSSVGGLGRKDCEVNILGVEEARAIEANAIQPWLQFRVAEFQGEKLFPVTFPLGDTML